MRILVVDDDAVFRDEFVTFLQDEGHEASSAPSARKAVEAIEADAPDVLFTDLKMPRQSGLELLRDVRQRWPQVFVVMVTGYGTIETATSAMKSGAFDYITKPFRPEQVRQTLRIIGEERRFADASLHPSRTSELVRKISGESHRPVLYAGEHPPPVSAGVEFLRFDGQNPSQLVDALEGFLRTHPDGGMVVERVDRMLESHRLEDIIAVLRRLRDRLQGRGPFAVGLDPERVPRAQAEAVRAAVTAPAVQNALETLSNPVRRRALRRLIDGPATFGETMHASGLDDSPKMAFHMHRLVEQGYVSHSGDRYAITPRGTEAVRLLREIEDMAASTDSTLFVTSASPAEPDPAAPRRTG